MERNTGWIPWIAVTCFLLYDVTGLQFTPVALNGAGDGECALVLNGPGRSSSFDYSLNLLRGGNGFGYNGQHTCITYDAVNAAYLEARKRIQVAQPHGDYKPEEVATVGELLLDISINLARTYGLSYEDIEKGLPLIDTSKTLIREICPPFLANVECRPGKYRRFDGLCTNLENPTWGSVMQPFTRLIGPLYADGMTAPRISVTGNQLPLARVVSRTMHPDDGFHDHAGTVMVIAWGQFIDHDYTLTATPLDPLNRNDPEECCKRPPHLKNPYCNEIPIPEDDYFYRLFHVRCIDFVRGFPSARPGCRLGSRSQFNLLTGVLDANTVYGVTEKFSRKLRSGYGGQLRMNPIFREYGLKDLLPLKLDIPDEGCTRPNRSMYCFEAGEIRVNEQLVLTCMHTLMAREHNRISEGLAHVNPHWDDETLFQEARRINIAVIQHITYNEFLPILLGKEVMEKFGLLLQKDGYWDGHDSSVNPNVIDAFAAAAYRFGHSLLPTAVERWSKAHKFIASKRLSDLIRRPYDLYRAGVFDEYFMGLMNQVAQAMDDSITQEVTNHLFKKAGARFGMDLVSFNMQRGREFGLPGYMEFRKFCGLPGAETFDELFGSMPNETIHRYATIFEHPSDVDLWSGGVSERPLPGSMLGPTFACIIATQFSYSRRGDRFWYELPNQPSSFTAEQLREIKKARLARVICDNTDLIDTIQLYPMVLPDHEINPRVPCRSGVLPSMDFSKWADHGNQHFQQPFTNNLVEKLPINPKILLTNKVLHQKILESNLNGKHPYASLFTQKPLKSIKILPAIVLNPIQILKGGATINRIKRNTDEVKNLTTENIKLTNENTTEKQETRTMAPIIVDQVTEAITVTEISGIPPDNIEETGPLELKPLTITSNENTNNNENFKLEDIVDVGKFIQEKIQKFHQPGFQNFENAESKHKKIRYILEDEAEKEGESQKAHHRQNPEDIEDKNEEIVIDQDENPGHIKMLIHVPEFEETPNENEEKEQQQEEIQTQNLQKEEEKETPSIPDSYMEHFMSMGSFKETPEQLTLRTKEEKDANNVKSTGNVKINGEKFYLPVEIEDKVDQDQEKFSESEEIKEKNKYFDDIINSQMERNDKLQYKLEYPDLDKEYESYRVSADNGYTIDKFFDFATVDQPYKINLEGIFPYENGNDKEHTYKDDVDTNKKRLIKNEENKEEGNDKSDNSEFIFKDIMDTYKELFGQSEMYDNDEKDEPYSYRYNENMEDNKDISKENEQIMQNEEHNEKNEEQPDVKQEEETGEYQEEEEDEKETKEIKVLTENDKQATDNIYRFISDNHEDGEEKKKTKREYVIPTTTENFMETLGKILSKRDAISRQQDIEFPEEYNTFWSLEYRHPYP